MQLHRQRTRLHHGLLSCRWYISSVGGFCENYKYLTTPKRKAFATAQESVRKDVEKSFGVLQARWGIVRGAAMMWDPEVLWQVMTCCVILHKHDCGG